MSNLKRREDLTGTRIVVYSLNFDPLCRCSVSNGARLSVSLASSRTVGKMRDEAHVVSSLHIIFPLTDFYIKYLWSLSLRESARARGLRASRFYLLRRPQSRRDYPLNLSILLSGGKETNQDFLSSGERTGKSPAPNPAVPPQGNVVFGRIRLSRDVESRPSPS